MLTKKQQELLKFIDERVQADGVAPSFDEMREAINLKSKSGIHRLITGLEERGFIRRFPHRARALEVCRLPDALIKQRAENTHKSFPAHLAAIQIPMHGRIAAGTPIEALQATSRNIGVPPEMLGGGDHYALEVSGDSMIEAGIMDGDTVVIRKSDTAENGAIVVALITDDNEATLKRLYRKGRNIELEPANSTYETRVLSADRVQVQGQLVGLLRRY